MGELIQQVFNDISLEKDPMMWQSKKQSGNMTEKRTQFLIEFQETLFENEFDFAKSKSRKNDVLCDALINKSDKSKDVNEKIKFLSQALLFGTEQKIDCILRKRSALFNSRNEKKYALMDLESLQEKSNKDLEEIQTLLKDLDICDQNENSEEVIIGLTPMKIESQDLLESRHKVLKQFSSKVVLHSEEGRGRFLIAGEDIDPGDVISSETSYSAVLDRQFVMSNCDNCLRRLPDSYVLSCPRCSMVRFCSSRCQQQALTSHHKYECLIQDVLYNGGCGAWILAYRIVCSKPCQFWMESYKHLGVVEEDSEYESADINRVYNLVTHDIEDDREAPTLMKEALTAVFFLRCLQAKGYFSNPTKTGTLTQQELVVAKLLHHFMRVVFYNSHEVTELQPNNKWTCNKIVKIGVAINPSLALINHSCDPNYARVEKGKNVLAFATRLIRKGEEILDVYSGTFVTSEQEDRAEVHQRYNFECRCQACSLNWSTGNLLPKNINRKHLRDKTIPDASVKKSDKIYKQLTNMEWLSKMSSKECRREISILLKNSEVMHPHYLKYQAEDVLHKTLWDTYGKV